MKMLKPKRNQLVFILPLLGVTSLALGLGGCGNSNNKTAQQNAQAKAMIQNAAGYLNPTVSTPTELEGTWLTAQCVPGNFSQGAQSFSKGYIFVGNSFYRQVDYFASNDCSWNSDQTLAQGRVYSDIAAGWFSVSQGSGYKNINMLAAPNFGSSYDLNIYQLQGSGTSATLLMGDNTIDSTQRPASLSITYQHWDISTFGN